MDIKDVKKLNDDIGKAEYGRFRKYWYIFAAMFILIFAAYLYLFLNQ